MHSRGGLATCGTGARVLAASLDPPTWIRAGCVVRRWHLIADRPTSRPAGAARSRRGTRLSGRLVQQPRESQQVPPAPISADHRFVCLCWSKKRAAEVHRGNQSGRVRTGAPRSRLPVKAATCRNASQRLTSQSACSGDARRAPATSGSWLPVARLIGRRLIEAVRAPAQRRTARGGR